MKKKLYKVPLGKWMTIDPKRTDKELVVETIKNEIDLNGAFEFNDDYTKFRRIEPFSEFIKRVDGMFVKGSMGYSIEWHDPKDVEFNYDKLPEAQLKSYSSKEWNKKKGRQ